MTTQEQIVNAIAAHGRWKAQLDLAVSKGSAGQMSSTVRRDDACDFGKWLKSADAGLQRSAEFRKCAELHARFHGAAAQVVQLVEAGKTDQAKQAMAMSGDFMKVSALLTAAMMDWRRALPS